MYVPLSVCLMCASMHFFKHPECIKMAPGWKKLRERKKFGLNWSTEFAFGPRLGDSRVTVHPAWMPDPTESTETHCRQSQLSFSSAMQWQTGKWVINFKVVGFWRSAIWIVGELLIEALVSGGWWDEMKWRGSFSSDIHFKIMIKVIDEWNTYQLTTRCMLML